MSLIQYSNAGLLPSDQGLGMLLARLRYVGSTGVETVSSLVSFVEYFLSFRAPSGERMVGINKIIAVIQNDASVITVEHIRSTETLLSLSFREGTVPQGLPRRTLAVL